VSYDLNTAWTANEQFLWHHSWQYRQWSSWWTGATAATALNGMVNVDVKTQRRLEPNLQLQLLVQWNFRSGTNNNYRLRVMPRLRTLLEQV